MQPLFQFEDYPNDKQTIYLRYGSYAFSQSLLNLTFENDKTGSAVSYNKNFNNDATFTTNPVWQHDQSWHDQFTYVSPSSQSRNAVFAIDLERTSTGILVRLVIPVTILTVIGGLIFWSHPKERVSLTVTLLLSVAAMYVVIIGNIPLVGYLTAVDKYCFMMFVILAVAIVFHQIYYIMLIRSDEDKTDELERSKRISEINQLRTHISEAEAAEANEVLSHPHGHIDTTHPQASGSSIHCPTPQVHLPGSPSNNSKPPFLCSTSHSVSQATLRKEKSMALQKQAIMEFKLLSARDRILYDIRTFCCKALEIFGRLVVVPFAVISFTYIFSDQSDTTSTSNVDTGTVMAVFLLVVIATEIYMITKDVITANQNRESLSKLLEDAKLPPNDTVLGFWKWLFQIDQKPQSDTTTHQTDSANKTSPGKMSPSTPSISNPSAHVNDPNQRQQGSVSPTNVSPFSQH